MNCLHHNSQFQAQKKLDLHLSSEDRIIHQRMIAYIFMYYFDCFLAYLLFVPFP